MSSSQRVPLSARPKDLAMFIYFASHIPTSMMMDLLPLYPSFLRGLLQPLYSFLEYYIENFRDPFMASRNLIWFNTFLHMEGLVQLPIFFFAAWALYNNKRSVALWICVYASHVITTVLPCIATLALGKPNDFPFEISDSQKRFLICLYMPWFLFPLWMLVECFGRVRSFERASSGHAKKSQ